jgi:hypothetical protein
MINSNFCHDPESVSVRGRCSQVFLNPLFIDAISTGSEETGCVASDVLKGGE